MKGSVIVEQTVKPGPCLFLLALHIRTVYPVNENKVIAKISPLLVRNGFGYSLPAVPVCSRFVKLTVLADLKIFTTIETGGISIDRWFSYISAEITHTSSV